MILGNKTCVFCGSAIGFLFALLFALLSAHLSALLSPLSVSLCLSLYRAITLGIPCFQKTDVTKVGDSSGVGDQIIYVCGIYVYTPCM